MADETALRFQQASLAAIDTLLPLIAAYYQLDEIAHDEATIVHGLHQLCSDSSLGGVWLVQLGAAPIGYFVLTFGFDLEFGGRVGIVTELYLVPSARRRGFGRATLRFVEQTLQARGVYALELQAERHNAEALAFYDSFGMTRHDRIPLSKTLAKP